MPFPATSGALHRLRQLLFAAASAGALSGVFAAIAHQIVTVPIIHGAEVYERAAERSEPAGEPQAWEPGDGLERTAYTALADVTTGVGFALLLIAALAWRGEPSGWQNGIYWGLAGFAAFALAPGLGLPPELPGTQAAPLVDRQLWWVATAALTASGLALLFGTRSALAALAGIALIALPHLHGAPSPAQPGALAPEALARQFASSATAVSFLFWTVLGGSSGYFHARFASGESAREADAGEHLLAAPRANRVSR